MEDREETTAEFELYKERGGTLLCRECNMSVQPDFRFCPHCGSALPEVLRRSEHTEPQRPASRRRARPKVNERAEETYREFNAMARIRRKKRRQRSGVFVLLLFLLLLGAFVAGLYWFFASPKEWRSEVIEQPKAVGKATEVVPEAPPVTAPAAHEPSPAVSAEPEKEPEVVVPSAPNIHDRASLLEVTEPTRGVVVGSNVNVRAFHSLTSGTVGKVSSGGRVEVLESWNSGESPEAVALADIQVTGPNGQKKSVLRGRGVTVMGEPDAQGVVEITFPEDKTATRYRVAAASLSAPQAWPWYHIKWQGKEGWIFGKFLAVVTPKEATLPPEYLRIALSSFGTTEEALQAVLGKPSRKTSKKTGNTVVTTLVFKGATVVLADQSGASEVRSITVTSKEYPLDGGLAVGMERRAVLSALGFPNDVAGGSEHYRVDKTRGIRITYQDYRVKSLVVGPLS